MKIIMDDSTEIGIESIKTIQMEPGEVLAVIAQHRMSLAMYSDLSHTLRKVFPKTKILIIDNRFDFKKVRFIEDEE